MQEHFEWYPNSARISRQLSTSDKFLPCQQSVRLCGIGLHEMIEVTELKVTKALLWSVLQSACRYTVSGKPPDVGRIALLMAGLQPRALR